MTATTSDAVTSGTRSVDRRQRVVVARVADFPVGTRKILKVGGREIGVFHTRAGLYALRNSCPHQAAPLCLGAIKGMMLPGKPGEYVWAREGEILRCPWHGWEFDITTGRSIFNPHRTRVKTYAVTVEPEDEGVDTYPVTVEDGVLVLHV